MTVQDPVSEKKNGRYKVGFFFFFDTLKIICSLLALLNHVEGSEVGVILTLYPRPALSLKLFPSFQIFLNFPFFSNILTF